MFNTKNWIYLGLIVAALAVFIPRSAAQTISCSSDDGKRHYCSANGSGRARLVNQRSESACTEGYSWGSDNRGIWVDHGCRADFAIEGERGGGDRDREGDGNRDRDGDSDGYRRDNPGLDQAQVISCSSDDMHRHYCQADTRGGVQLIKQHSDASCRQGGSWGFDRRGIWVDHGCRADFQVGGGDRDREGDRNRDRDGDNDGYRHDNQGSDQAQVISCSSDDMHRHYCQADTRGGVQLIKQHSDASCRQGGSWGFDRRGIWVDHGCRADFQVGR